MTKLDILNQTTALNIYYYYLGISTHPNGNISSPFSDDKNPSFKLYKNGTFKCHSTGKQGDVFQFVADLKELDVKSDFHKVLKEISEDLQLHISTEEKDKSIYFKIETIPLTNEHYLWYSQFKVSKSTLDKYNVQSLSKFQYWNSKKNDIQKFPIYKGVLAFSYTINNRFEVYIPKQDKVDKFFYNQFKHEDIFGLDQLNDNCTTGPVESLIISAGKKDCLVLNSNGYNSITFRSENHYPTKNQIDLLKSKCKKLFICYDNDFDKPNNPGQKAQSKIVSDYDLIPIHLPEGINDIAQLYSFNRTLDESYKEALEYDSSKAEQFEAQEEANKTIFHITERYLNAHYRFRYNTIKLDIECTRKGYQNWESVNENSLYIEMQKKGINISIDKLLAILKSNFVEKYNPISEYFNQLPKWKKSDKDYIEQLSNHVSAANQKQFNYHFKKWLVRTVKCATIPEYFNKQAFILVHKAQNSGKTSFCRFLCPPKLKEYLAEDISNDKDARVLLCKNLLINLDELAVLNKQEINSLKAYFTKAQINERLPYDRKNSIIPRVCSFIGSTNQDEFLADETGSVRWLCFLISSIDWSYRSKVNIDNVWMQAVALANDSNFDCEMSIDDIKDNEQRNKDFQMMSQEQELLVQHFKPDGDVFMTSTEIMMHIIKMSPFLPRNINKIAMGRALAKEGFERKKNTVLDRYGYFVYILSKTETLTPESIWKNNLPPINN